MLLGSLAKLQPKCLKLSQDLLPATKARSLPTDGVVAMVLGPSWRRSHPDLPEKQAIELLGAIAQERLVCHNRSPFKQRKEDSDPLCGYPMLSMPQSAHNMVT